MTWDDKIALCNALNSEEYDQAVRVMHKSDDWDNQSLSMFLNGFSIIQVDKLAPIKIRFMSIDTDNLDIRAKLRYEVFKQKLESL